MNRYLLQAIFSFFAFTGWAQSPQKLTGEMVYNNNCLACHQADGRGVMGLNPPLTKTQWVLGDKKALISIVLKGMKQTIEVEDEFYSNPMPSHAHLTDKEIADVLTYIRSRFGNKASSITELEVKNIRIGK